MHSRVYVCVHTGQSIPRRPHACQLSLFLLWLAFHAGGFFLSVRLRCLHSSRRRRLPCKNCEQQRADASGKTEGRFARHGGNIYPTRVARVSKEPGVTVPASSIASVLEGDEGSFWKAVTVFRRLPDTLTCAVLDRHQRRRRKQAGSTPA